MVGLATIGVARNLGRTMGAKGAMLLPKFLAYLVVLCSERRCPISQNKCCCSLKVEIFGPSQNLRWLRHCLEKRKVSLKRIHLTPFCKNSTYKIVSN